MIGPASAAIAHQAATGHEVGPADDELGRAYQLRQREESDQRIAGFMAMARRKSGYGHG